MSVRNALRAALTVEGLEERSLPSSTPLLIESFQTPTASGLPTGWTQWSGNKSPVFRYDGAGGLGGTGELVATAPTGVAARTWISNPFSADVEATAAVYLNSLDPLQLFLRGRNLGSNSPTYYAASIVRGTEVQLVRVMNGQETVIGATRSGDYVSNMWVQLTIRAENNVLTVQVRRTDSGRYLDSSGNWSSEPVNAITILDSGIASAGQVGFNRGTRSSDSLVVDNLYVNQVAPESRSVYQVEGFDTETNGALPDGWGIWSTGNSGTARTTPDQALSVGGSSNTTTRLWINRTEPADIQVTSSVYLNSLAPTQLFARASGVDTSRPSYYAVSVTRGLNVQLLRVANGQQTVLGSVRSASYVSSQWIQVSLVVKGNQLRAQVFRTDTAQYLQADGKWGLAPAWALVSTDNAITRAGYAGLGRGAGGTDAVTFDNFVVSSAPLSWNETSPIPTQNDKPTPLPPPPDVSGPSPTPAPTPTPTPTPAPGTGTGSTTLPVVPQHLAWIRLAELAYYGTPLNATEQALLRNDVDLVIPNAAYMSQIASVSPTTPQFIYSNVSNIYQSLLTDWLQYADQNRLNRESAFYHVTHATPYSGMSASAVPVNQFWGVYSGSNGRWTDLTSAAHNANKPFALGGVGSSLAVGYTEKFREIDVGLQAATRGSWGGQWQYVTAVDAKGNPTAWARLNVNQDGTGNMRRSGTITFDPPANWVTASVNGSARLYYVRFVTGASGGAPVVRSLLGADYTNSHGTSSGTIPAFDYSADTNHDGYLSDAEYARRKPGDDARFAYQSRVFYPSYGPNRFATNVSNPAFRAWAINYQSRLLAGTPHAAGVFIDNSVGKLAIDPTTVRESMSNYTADYASLLGAINKQISPKWVIANTGGGGPSANPISQNGVSSLEEFALRPMSANTVQFQDLAATLAYREQLGGGKAYQILDSLPTNGYDANDPRVQLTTLAMYYLLADPKLTFLMMNGGNEPSSDWSRHFTAAIQFNVGKPLATWSVFATGQDPSNTSLAYTVYSREYQNALVLYKPVAYSHGVSGQTTDATATTQYLGGTYREVRADGTLGPPITRITLRNGEGVILARMR